MAAPIDEQLDMSQSQSQSLLEPSTPLILGTNSGNKRTDPCSPDLLPATQKQTQRQIKRRNSYGDLRELQSTSKKSSTARKSLADKILDALSSPEVLNAIIPVLADKITESLSANIEEEVQKRVDQKLKPLTEQVETQKKTIEQQGQKITRQFIDIAALQKSTEGQIQTVRQQSNDIDYLNRRINELEFRIENQEQYSRRTSLRFHNIRVPVDGRGKIIHPVDTDQLVLNIINQKLNLKDITINDIGRSHVIGKVKDGKSQVIVRFLSYRTRHLVYSSKKQLKGDADGHYITENLTKFRTTLVQQLSKLKFDKQIEAFWTFDGRIFAKKTERSRKMIIKDKYDIEDLLNSTEEPRQEPTNFAEALASNIVG